MKQKKLPIGIQTFSKIREDNYIYIDKTALALKMIEDYQYVFLSRPRRFGKSLFLDTLRNIFEANKEHFSGLAIENKWDWSISHPVILISFAEGKLKSLNDLHEKFEEIFKQNQKRLGIECEYAATDRRCFSQLIQKANEKYTQKDVETTFAPYLEDVDMDKLKCWYNGYNFLGSDMYNPFDILQFK